VCGVLLEHVVLVGLVEPAVDHDGPARKDQVEHFDVVLLDEEPVVEQVEL